MDVLSHARVGGLGGETLVPVADARAELRAVLLVVIQLVLQETTVFHIFTQSHAVLVVGGGEVAPAQTGLADVVLIGDVG